MQVELNQSVHGKISQSDALLQHGQLKSNVPDAVKPEVILCC